MTTLDTEQQLIQKTFEDLAPVKIADCELSATDAQFAPDIPLARWTHIGHQLVTAHKSLPWWIGAWVNYGMKAYGDEIANARLASQIFGHTAATCAEYARVARLVPMRIGTLGFQHHQLVSAMSANMQKSFLDAAEEHEMTVSELREAIALELMTAPKQTTKAVKTFIGWVGDGLRLVASLRDKVDSWDEHERLERKQELQPVVDFYNSL